MKFLKIDGGFETITDEDIEMINSYDYNRIEISSFRGLTSEILDKLDDKFEYYVVRDVLANVKYYLSYTKEEMKEILLRMDQMKSLILDNEDELNKSLIIYKYIGMIVNQDREALKRDPSEDISGGISFNVHGFYSSKNKQNPQLLSRSLLGALIQGRAVCEGYALALEKCLDYVGVSAKIVDGLVDGKTPHAWIQVKINDVWYNADLTKDIFNIRNHQPLKYCLKCDQYYKENGYEFWGYKHVAGKINKDRKLELCSNDYPRDERGLLIGDHSSKVDEFFENLIKFYEQWEKRKLEKEKQEESSSKKR